MTFFALSCFYFLITAIGVIRLCNLNQSSAASPDDPNILSSLLCYMVAACVLRLLGWLVCTTYFMTDGRYLYVKPDTFEQISSLNQKVISSNETVWLPLEPTDLDGINAAPVVLVLAITSPEIFVVITYLALCWLCFAAYIDAHD